MITEPGREAPVERRSFVAGIHSGYATTAAPPRQHGVEIRLTPLGAYTLLDVPMNSLANRAVALDDVLGGEAEALAERLSSMTTWQGAVPLPRRVVDAAAALRPITDAEHRLGLATIRGDSGPTPDRRARG